MNMCGFTFITRKKEKPVGLPLLPSATIKGARFNKHWQIYINTKVESEI